MLTELSNREGVNKMINFKKIAITGAAAATMFGMTAVSAFAAYTLFGDASVVPGGNPGNAAQIRSDAIVAPGYGGVIFDVPAGLVTLADLTTLSTDFNVTDDDCGGGSPRFQLRIDFDNDGVVGAGDKNIFVYPGPYPNFTGCTPNTWTSTGNLVTDSDKRWDTGQVGGTFYDTYANAVALTAGLKVLRISMVVDSSWMFGDSEQTVLVDNINVNGDITTFDPVVLIGKATGGLNLGNPRQHMSFNAFDYGSSNLDMGVVEYSNFDYPGGLHYNADVLCANVDKENSDSWFAYEIPDGHPGLSGLGIMVRVHDGGTPGKKGDTFGFSVAANGTGAVALCEAGSTPTNNYPVTGGNAVVHK